MTNSRTLYATALIAITGVGGCVTSVSTRYSSSFRNQERVPTPTPQLDETLLPETEETPPPIDGREFEAVPPQPSAASRRLLPFPRARTVSATRSSNRAEKNLFD